MCKQFWVGIDLGKESFQAAIAPEGAHVSQWAKLPVKEFANTGHGLRSLCA